MTARLVRQHTAARLGVAGSTLGVLAGVLQAAIGSHLGTWSGNKNSALALGLLTVVLSLVALTGALKLRAPASVSAERNTVLVIAVLVPAGLCFSTVGPLWYLPGALLLLSSGLALGAGRSGELRPVLGTYWTRGLVSLLGAFEILMSVTAGPVLAIAVGVVGGLALMAAPWVAKSSRPAGVLLLVAGTVPFAALTWWSAASPLLAIAALAIGIPASRYRRVVSIRGERAATVPPEPSARRRRRRRRRELASRSQGPREVIGQTR